MKQSTCRPLSDYEEQELDICDAKDVSETDSVADSNNGYKKDPLSPFLEPAFLYEGQEEKPKLDPMAEALKFVF